MKKLFCFLLFVLFISSPALADQVLEKKTKIFGKEFSVKEQLGSLPSGNGVSGITQVKFLNKSIPLLNSKLEYTEAKDTIESTSNDLYVNGIKVWTGSGTNENGTISYGGGVAPTQINMPVFSYTVGPLVLQVNAGVEFEAAVDAKLSSPLLLPDLSTLPTKETLVDASLKTNATASGYVEGLARVLIVQVGLGGDVNIIDGNAEVIASIPFLDPMNPTLSYDGKLQVLNGKIYGFIDYRKLGGWKRWKDFNLYSWKGMCWAMGAQSCGTLQ
jgi:hypothetical protein